jgi:Low-density lipoprotein receptor domain class A
MRTPSFHPLCNVAKSPKDFGPEGCNDNEWQCDNRECINHDFLCDGAVDCTDKSDESPANCGNPPPVDGNTDGSNDGDSNAGDSNAGDSNADDERKYAQ